MINETKTVVEGYNNYLKGIYFGILKDCEKGKDYDALLDSLLIELMGWFGTDKECIFLHKLYAQTATLKYLKYKFFRNTILSVCMPLVDKIFGGDE